MKIRQSTLLMFRSAMVYCVRLERKQVVGSLTEKNYVLLKHHEIPKLEVLDDARNSSYQPILGVFYLNLISPAVSFLFLGSLSSSREIDTDSNTV